MRIEDAFHDQARSNRALGSPFTAEVLDLLAERINGNAPILERLRSWTGDVGNRGASVPLRFLGGLHALVLTGECPELAACYPPNPHPGKTALSNAIDTAIERHDGRLNRWLDNPPQTNEVRRSAVIIAAAHWLAARYDLTDFVLSELGASAGLNLMWDRYRLDLACGQLGPRKSPVRLDPEWRGSCPPEAELTVRDRRGVDLSPMDPHDKTDALRLTSFLWPDQPWRLERAREAIKLYDAEVDKGDAPEWLERRLVDTHPGAIHMVAHTVAWQYFEKDTAARCLAALEEAGARATKEAPLVRLSMEGDARKGEGAPIEITLWPGGRQVKLGRVDFHGRWVDWAAP